MSKRKQFKIKKGKGTILVDVDPILLKEWRNFRQRGHGVAISKELNIHPIVTMHAFQGRAQEILIDAITNWYKKNHGLVWPLNK